MPEHKPIKFESSLEPNLKKQVLEILKENPKSKTTLNVALGIIAAGGILTFGPIAPAILGGLAKMRIAQSKENYKKYRKIWYSFRALKRHRALKFIKEEDGYLLYRLTDKGKEKIKKFTFDELKIKNPKKWDGKWHLVIFDIPETRRKLRVALRNKLKELGFYQCQKSAWIYPFSCAEEIEFIKNVLNIKPFVRLFVVEEMDDGKVIYHFRNLIKKAMMK